MLNFALLQTNIKFCDAEYNFENVKKLFHEAMKHTSSRCCCFTRRLELWIFR